MAILRLEPSFSWNVGKRVSEFSDYRRSDQMFFQLGENELIRHIEQKITDHTHIPIENGEGLQVVRYVTAKGDTIRLTGTILIRNG